MSVLNTTVSFKNNQVIATFLSLENGSLKEDVRHYDSIFFGSVGTLVHLSQLQYDSFAQTLKERNLPAWNKVDYEKSLTSTGGKNRLAIWSAANNLGLSEQDCADIHARKSAIFQENMKKDGLVVRPGVIDLLEQARANGVKTAFVTTTPLENVEAMLDTMVGFKREMLDFKMSEADAPKYGRGKPTADPYLYAMKQLGVKTPLVFEDSEISMKSPLAANLDVIATPNNWCVSHDYNNAQSSVTEPSDLLRSQGLSDEESAQLTVLLKKASVKTS